MERNDVRPGADGNADVAGQKHAEAQKKGSIFSARVEIAPDDDQHDQAGSGDGQQKKEVGYAKPAHSNIGIHVASDGDTNKETGSVLLD